MSEDKVERFFLENDAYQLEAASRHLLEEHCRCGTFTLALERGGWRAGFDLCLDPDSEDSEWNAVPCFYTAGEAIEWACMARDRFAMSELIPFAAEADRLLGRVEELHDLASSDDVPRSVRALIMATEQCLDCIAEWARETVDNPASRKEVNSD